MPAIRNGELKVRFWGVRGSVPTPEESHLQIGGNTPCVVLQYNDEPVVMIDAGTGLRVLGQHLSKTGEQPFRGTLLLSHFHWDHIQGFPFFSPIYSKFSKLRIYSGRKSAELENNLERQMQEPFFPMGFRDIPLQYSCAEVKAEGFESGSLSIRPVHLNHPGHATGFRIDSPGGSFIYVSDHEHGDKAIDQQIVRMAETADMMVYDAHFTPEEYPSFIGWGHSTWLEGTRLAKEAGVQELVLFHHHPARTDREMVSIVGRAQEHFENTTAAAETSKEWVAGRGYKAALVP